MADIRQVLESDGPLKLQLLHSLSKYGLKHYFESDEPSINKVKAIWAKLLDSAHSLHVDEKYLTAVCNAVSVFLLQLAVTKDENLQAFVFSEEVWLDASASAQKAFRKGKTKPALQVLETLCHLTDKNPDDFEASGLLQKALEHNCDTIFVNPGHHDVKVACISLSCFVRKVKVSFLPRLLSSRYTGEDDAWENRLQSHGFSVADLEKEATEPILMALVLAIQHLETRSAALKLLILLCTRSPEEDPPQDLFGAVTKVIRAYLGKNKDAISDFTHNVFPVILDERQRWTAFFETFKTDQYEDEAQTLQFLAVLRVGRLHKFITQEGNAISARLLDMLTSIQNSSNLLSWSQGLGSAIYARHGHQVPRKASHICFCEPVARQHVSKPMTYSHQLHRRVSLS